MYPITNEVMALFEAEQQKVLRITGTDKNGAVISITDNDVIADSFQVDRYSCNGEKLEVGTAIAAQMTLTLENGGGQYNGIVFEGAELFVEVGIADWTQSSPTITYVPCGYFTPDNQPRRLSTISITALDRMTKFDVVVDAVDLTFPTTIAGLVGQVCTLCGVTLAQSISGLVNAGVAVTALPTAQEEITYRNLIQWCAGIMGTNAWFDWNGQLRFSWYANATGYVSTADNRYSSDLYEDDLTVSGVEYTNNSGIVIVEGTDDYAIDLTGNAIVGPLVATVLPPLNTALNGFTYRPFTAATVNAPYLWPMDIVTFTDKDGNNHTSALTNVAFGLNGTTAMESKGMTYAINKLAQPKGFTREQAQLVSQAMEHVEQDIDESLTQQDIFNRLTDDGAAQGMVLYNGQLYINASYINAGYLNADHIQGGTLTLGGSGNTRGTLQILNGFNQVCGGWSNSRMFSNGFQFTQIVDGELVVWGTITPMRDGGISIHNYDDPLDIIANFSPDMTSLHNKLYVYDGASIKGVLRLPDEPLYVQYGGTGATTAADARTNLGITPANIGAVAKSGDTMTGALTAPDFIGKINNYTWDLGTEDTVNSWVPVLDGGSLKHRVLPNWLNNMDIVPVGRGGTGATNAADARANLDVPSTTGSGASGTWGINVSGGANALAPTGFHVVGVGGALSYYSSDDNFYGRSGWAHYIIANHGDAVNYFNYVLALPFWGKPQYKRQTGSQSAQSPWYEFLTTESPVLVTEGGTGATTAAGARANLEITPANIGAVAKSGDTMTGPLRLDNADRSNRGIHFNANGSEIGWFSIEDSGYSQNVFQFIQHNPNVAGAFSLFQFPPANDNPYGFYEILTTKSAVTIPQGGTGATDAPGARANLGIATTVTTFQTNGITANGNFNTGLRPSQHVIDAIYCTAGHIVITPYCNDNDYWFAHCIHPTTGAVITTNFQVTIRYHNIY